LGLRPRQRDCKVPGAKARGSPGVKAKALQRCGPRRSRESHHKLPGVLESVTEYEGMNPHTPKATPTLGDGVPVDSETSKSDCKGQTSISCGVLYIIEKLLKRRCLKWVRIAHLNI